jgi:hypothetical protein
VKKTILKLWVKYLELRLRQVSRKPGWGCTVGQFSGSLYDEYRQIKASLDRARSQLAMYGASEIHAISEWLASENNADPANYLLAVALASKLPTGRANLVYPRNATELGRCIKLIEVAPSVRLAAFPLLAKASPQWSALIDRWDFWSRGSIYPHSPEEEEIAYHRAITLDIERALNAIPGK